MDLLNEKINGLPLTPGVYIMRDRTGNVIYVGKAVVLKNRVRQYFMNKQTHPKVAAMVENVADFDYIITLSEKDALSLESNLIKKYKPKYNILLKDDKASPFIKIDLREKFPTIEVTRKVKKDGAKYFGPFMNGVYVWDIVAVIRSAYGMRTCPKKLHQNARECLNYHIGLCLAPCTGRVDKETYDKAVHQVMAFLSGRDDAASALIEQKMNQAAQNEQFEQAIYYRDKLNMLAKMKERTLANLNGVLDLDAFAYASSGEYGCVSVCIVRGGKMMGVKNFIIPDVSLSETEAVEGFMRQYYAGANVDLPPQICVAFEREGGALEEFLFSLKGVKTEIVTPKIGTKHKLLETALGNAEDYLEKSAEKTKRDRDMTLNAAGKLAEILGIASARRMECYDISNISGVDKVASMVVFIDGAPSKSDYRRFKIKTVEGANDFMSMNEVIRRRFARAANKDDKFSELPDLVVIDGGKGQLSAAYSAMNSEGFDVPMVGLAKREEEVFTVFDEKPIVLSKASFPLKLLQRIRDEAHRFAITYHRNLRAKRYGSRLEDIQGVGEVKRRILLRAFGSVEQIKQAAVEELRAVTGIDARTAANVFAYFHPEDCEAENAAIESGAAVTTGGEADAQTSESLAEADFSTAPDAAPDDREAEELANAAVKKINAGGEQTDL